MNSVEVHSCSTNQLETDKAIRKPNNQWEISEAIQKQIHKPDERRDNQANLMQTKRVICKRSSLDLQCNNFEPNEPNGFQSESFSNESNETPDDQINNKIITANSSHLVLEP
jgi:hypothetical protein